jgi:hypothetical protein
MTYEIYGTHMLKSDYRINKIKTRKQEIRKAVALHILIWTAILFFFYTIITIRSVPELVYPVQPIHKVKHKH